MTKSVASALQTLDPVTHVANTRQMDRRPIPSTGEMLAVIGCGTWPKFDVASDTRSRAPLADVLSHLVESGGSMVDTSPMYGRAEAVGGDCLEDLGIRDRVFLATKVWTRGRAAGVSRIGIEQMERSLQLFRTARVDLMQIHSLVDWRTHLPTLRAWKAESRIRYIGITHYTDAAHGDLEAVMRAEPIDFVQLNYSLEERAAADRLLPLAADRGIAVIVNRPFGGGDFVRSLRARVLPSWAGEIGCETWAQILLKFALAHPAVTCVIPGTGRAEHMAENCRAGYGPMLDRALEARLIADARG